MGQRLFTALIAVEMELEEGERLPEKEEKELLTQEISYLLQELPRSRVAEKYKLSTEVLRPNKDFDPPSRIPQTKYVFHISRGGLLRYSSNGSTSYDNYSDKK